MVAVVLMVAAVANMLVFNTKIATEMMIQRKVAARRKPNKKIMLILFEDED